MALKIPVTDNSRKYGFLLWRKDDDQSARETLGGIKKVKIVFNGKPLKRERAVVWEYRRISLGSGNVRSIPAKHKYCYLTKKDSATIVIETK